MATKGSISLSSGGISVLPLLAGSEVSHSRRQIDLSDCSYCRVQYEGSGIGDLAIGVDYSLDSGSTWNSLLPAGPTIQGNGVVLSGSWNIFDSAATTDVIIRATSFGSSVLAFTIWYIDFQYR